MIADIETDRLVLRALSPAVLAASQLDDLVTAETELGLGIPKDWLAEKPLMAMRLQDMAEDSGYAPWSLRAIGLRSEHWMAGHIGFHGRPEDGTVELGYTIFASARRRGFAEEAVRGMLRWAAGNGATRYRLSIRPDNTASQALAAKLGFIKVGTRDDPVEGVEDVLERTELP
ncbi:MAG TPA: GNAT family protein [Geminicoccaceae bacterium]|nr:GNAT family protein [Geminicoccus sp.]HMU53167.1 GNAT family protein [Geminicoccaceae bacterium]